MWPNSQEIADLVIFTEENLNRKLHFCAVKIWRVVRLFEESNCSPYFFKVSFFSAELVAVIFSWRVLCYAAILSWWMCHFDQSKCSYLLSWRCIPANIRLDEDVLKTSWRRLSSSSSEDVFKTSSRRLDQDEHIRLGNTFSRRLQDVSSS